MASKNIESILLENRQFTPDPAFSTEAHITANQLRRLQSDANENPTEFWAKQAQQEIAWMTPFTITLNSANAPHFRWFEDGMLNVSANCLDRHLPHKGDKIAIIFEGEKGDIQKISYAQLHQNVCRFANALKATGVTKGDRVVISPCKPAPELAPYIQLYLAAFQPNLCEIVLKMPVLNYLLQQMAAFAVEKSLS